MHNVLRSSNVIEVGQIFFCHQPNFANDCNGLSYDGWLMCPPFFVSGTHFGALGGPWRVPGGSKNLPKQCILLWLPPMPQNGLNKAQTWLNITGHIQGDMLKPFRPLESATGGCQKHPKMANFEPKKTVFGRFWGSLVTFFGALMAQTGPPGCVWQCSTMFNHVQPMFNPFALAGTAYGQIWPFWAKKGCFWALLGPPGDIFLGP